MQRGYFINDDISNEFKVNPKILVRHEVSKGNDLPPFYFWMGDFQIIGKMICSLPDNFKLPFDGETEHGIVVNVGLCLP